MSLPEGFTSPKPSHRGRKRSVTKGAGNTSAEASVQEKKTPKRSGGAHDGGQQFEIKMAAVIGLRGMARDDNFQLSTNAKDLGNQLSTNKAGFGKFDDLVYTIDKKTRYFLQLKHTDNQDTTKLVHSKLVPLLHQCFESYCSIIQDPTLKEFERLEFIIYTNKRLGPKLEKHNRQLREIDEIFKTRDTGEIFNFTPDDNKEIDVYTLVENEVKDSSFEKISEFLQKLIMATGQKGQSEIEDVIIAEIRKLDGLKVGSEIYDDKDYQNQLLYFKTLLESWWRKRDEEMTPKILGNWLQTAKTERLALVVEILFKSYKQKSFGTEIKFSGTEVSWLKTELSNKRAVHLRSDAPVLRSILLLDSLDTSKCIFVTFESLQSNKNMLLSAWRGGNWEWLIVFCDSTVRQNDISQTCTNISEIINTNHSTKRAIILTACSVQQITDFVTVERKLKFEQLSEESQEMVLENKIDFQGCEVTMRSVLQRHGNVEHVLGPELVIELLTEGTAVNIGGRLQANEGYYAPRVLERKIWLHSNVLRNSNDVFVVSGTTKEDIFKILSPGKTVESVSLEDFNKIDFTQDMRDRIFVLSDKEMENSFLEDCEKLEGKTLHWVEFKNGSLLWKKSRGSIDSLLDYINTDEMRADTQTEADCSYEVKENSIWNLDQRAVLVVAGPGMGKSSTTTQLAWNKKLADPSSWVVRINWNDHTKKLQNFDEANLESLIKFLCSAAFPESKYTDINRSLLEHALQYSGNVTVLMDGFDEISPTHADKAAVILSELMKTKVERVWVTSRPVQKERLEKELSVIAFGMKRLSPESQKEMLRNLLKNKADETEEELNNFLRSVNRSAYDENFTGNPQHIKLIATVYKMDAETQLNLRDLRRRKIDLANMYDKYFEMKFHIYRTEKRKADESNAYDQDDHECVKKTHTKNFENCVLVVTLPPSILKLLHNNKIKEEILPFLEDLQAGKVKTGVVMNVVDDKPQFEHRTFAEYLTARWFKRNFKENRSAMEHILFDRGFTVIADMFNRMLARQFPLHCAVLNRERERMENLLKEECDVNALDEGGRTVMHIIATDSDVSGDIINRIFNDNVSLDITDSVLHWTPLQYAIKSEDWFIVERLLENNVDRYGLDMIRQRAHDAHYIGSIIIQAAQYGHLLLLEYLLGIGVNIHQASDRGFFSPLHAAIEGQQLNVVKRLIQHGADCKTRYSDGQTPLCHAINRGSFEVVRALVEEGGASPDIHDVHGNTAIDEATRSLQILQCMCSEDYVEGQKKIVKYLEKKPREKSGGSCIVF